MATQSLIITTMSTTIFRWMQQHLPQYLLQQLPSLLLSYQWQKHFLLVTTSFHQKYLASQLPQISLFVDLMLSFHFLLQSFSLLFFNLCWQVLRVSLLLSFLIYQFSTTFIRFKLVAVLVLILVLFVMLVKLMVFASFRIPFVFIRMLKIIGKGRFNSSFLSFSSFISLQLAQQ